MPLSALDVDGATFCTSEKEIKRSKTFFTTSGPSGHDESQNVVTITVVVVDLKCHQVRSDDDILASTVSTDSRVLSLLSRTASSLAI